MVRMEGLEPPRLAAPEPKSGASTNFATSARPVYNRMRPISWALRKAQPSKRTAKRQGAAGRVPTKSPQWVLVAFLIGLVALLFGLVTSFIPATAGGMAEVGMVRLLIMEPDGELITERETARATLTDSGQRWLVVNASRMDRDLDQWLAHEMAHLEAWKRYGTDIAVHGPEFRKVCGEFVTRRQNYFCNFR